MVRCLLADYVRQQLTAGLTSELENKLKRVFSGWTMQHRPGFGWVLGGVGRKEPREETRRAPDEVRPSHDSREEPSRGRYWAGQAHPLVHPFLASTCLKLQNVTEGRIIFISSVHVAFVLGFFGGMGGWVGVVIVAETSLINGLLSLFSPN